MRFYPSFLLLLFKLLFLSLKFLQSIQASLSSKWKGNKSFRKCLFLCLHLQRIIPFGLFGHPCPLPFGSIPPFVAFIFSSKRGISTLFVFLSHLSSMNSHFIHASYPLSQIQAHSDSSMSFALCFIWRRRRRNCVLFLHKKDEGVMKYRCLMYQIILYEFSKKEFSLGITNNDYIIH